jgi:hypothetical protein
MLTDPRVGLLGSLAVAAVAALWLLAQWPFGDRLFELMSYTQYAVDLLAIFLLIAGLAVALLFQRYQRVKADLLAGRNVIARWRASTAEFAAFATVADARDRADKRGALFLVFGFVVVIFGAFAIFDPEAAPFMLAIAALLMAAIVLAFLCGNRVRKKQLEPRSGEIIVGTDGLLVNEVLHVWRTPLSWFSGTRIELGPPALMTVTYGFLARYGVQYVDVMLPVPEDAMPLARTVEQALGTGRRRRARSQTANRRTG